MSRILLPFSLSWFQCTEFLNLLWTSTGLAQECEGAVRPAINISRLRLINKAINDSCTLKYVSLWSGPPSEYTKRIWWFSILGIRLGFLGQKLRRTHNSEGIGISAGHNFLTSSMRSRTEIALAMNVTIPCLLSCTLVQADKYSEHLSQNTSKVSFPFVFNWCKSIIVSGSSIRTHVGPFPLQLLFSQQTDHRLRNDIYFSRCTVYSLVKSDHINDKIPFSLLWCEKQGFPFLFPQLNANSQSYKHLNKCVRCLPKKVKVTYIRTMWVGKEKHRRKERPFSSSFRNKYFCRLNWNWAGPTCKYSMVAIYIPE